MLKLTAGNDSRLLQTPLLAALVDGVPALLILQAIWYSGDQTIKSSLPLSLFAQHEHELSPDALMQIANSYNSFAYERCARYVSRQPGCSLAPLAPERRAHAVIPKPICSPTVSFLQLLTSS